MFNVEDLLKQAYEMASKYSNDPRTQNGAILINKDGQIIGTGVNRLPIGVNNLPERLERPMKYSYLEHAERCAIYDAAKKGFKTQGATLIVPWYACVDCGRGIIEAGITTVIGHKQVFEAYGSGSWDESINTSNIMLKEAGVQTELYDGKLDCQSIMLNGKIWQP